jgi:hypothetical protein
VWFEGSPEAAPTIATFGPVGLAVVSAATVGALVASRRPRHPVGWLLLGVGLAVAVNVLVEPYVKYGLLVRLGGTPTPGLGRRAKLARADENGGHAPNPPRPRRASRSRPGSRLGGRRLLGG